MPLSVRSSVRLPVRFSVPLPVLLRTGALAAIVFALPVTRPALAQGTSTTWSIAGGSLDAALNGLARQARITLVFDPALVGGRTAAAGTSDGTVEQALERLLAPNGLRAVKTGDGSYAVQAAPLVAPRVAPIGEPPPAAAQTLERVTVTGRNETSTSRVDGYKADVSATATRIEVPLKDQPVSVVVVPKQFIDDLGTRNLTETADYVAGVSRETTGYAPSGQSFFIRGFSTYGGGNTLNGYRVDGFLGATDPSVVERIEFLKGPASVLYSTGPVTGLANTVTKRPTARAFADIDVTYGRFGYARTTIDASGPLGSDALLGRINIVAQRDEGFRRYPGSAINTVYGITPIVAARLSDTTRADLELSAIENRYGGRCDGVYLDEAFVHESIRKQFFCDRNAHADIGSYNARVEIVQDLSERWSLRAGGFFGRATSNRTEQYPLDYPDIIGPDGRTIERYSQYVYSYSLTGTAQLDLRGRFDTGPFAHRFTTGIERSGNRSPNQFFQAPATSMDFYDTRYDGRVLGPYVADGPAQYNASLSNAWFVQDFVEFGSQWKLLAGYRRDRVKSTSGEVETGVIDNRQTESGSAPRLGLVYEPTPDTTLYGSASRVFSPNLGSRTRSGDLLPASRGVQYEIGVKQELLERGASVTVSAFDFKYRDLATTDPTDPTGDFSVATGLQRSRGLEVELQGRLAPWWQVVAAYTYLDAFVAEDNVLPVGSRLTGAARHSGSLWNKVGFGAFGLPAWSVGVGVVAATDRQATLPNVPITLGSLVRIDAALFYEARPFRAQLNLRNAANRIVYDGQGFNRYPQSPRALQATVGYHF